MRLKFILVLFGMSICTIGVKAQEKAGDSEIVKEAKYRPVRLLICGALEFGGDDVATVYFTNGEDQSVKAGQGATISLGAQVQFPSVEKFLLRASIGYKYVTTQAENVHIRLTRVPLQFSANYMATERLRFGAGIVSHAGIKFNSGGLGGDMSFKSNVGPIFEIAYYGIGISYTALKYTDDENESYSASSFGITFSGVIPGGKK